MFTCKFHSLRIPKTRIFLTWFGCVGPNRMCCPLIYDQLRHQPTRIGVFPIFFPGSISSFTKHIQYLINNSTARLCQRRGHISSKVDTGTTMLYLPYYYGEFPYPFNLDNKSVARNICPTSNSNIYWVVEVELSIEFLIGRVSPPPPMYVGGAE